MITNFPALRQFMRCYWMENADIVYGDLDTAAREFCAREPASLIRTLSRELEIVEKASFLVDRPQPGSDEEGFWQQFGARWLSKNEAARVITILNE